MKIIDDRKNRIVKVMKGGRFELDNVIDDNTFYNEDGDKILRMTPEIYELIIDTESKASTRVLGDKAIKEICDFYKGKFLIMTDPENVEVEEQEGASYYEMDVHHVEYDKEIAEFTIFSTMKFLITPTCVYPMIIRDENDLIRTRFPFVYNCEFIKKTDDFTTTKEDFLETIMCGYNYMNIQLDLLGKNFNKLSKKESKKGNKKPKKNDNNRN